MEPKKILVLWIKVERERFSPRDNNFAIGKIEFALRVESLERNAEILNYGCLSLEVCVVENVFEIFMPQIDIIRVDDLMDHQLSNIEHF